MTFDIPGAVNFKGKLPKNSGMYPPGSNKITLKIPTATNNSVLLQFRLNKDNSQLLIYGYKDSVPDVTAHVSLSAVHPSMDSILRMGSTSQKKNVTKLRELMSQAGSISETQFYAIIDKLLSAKGGR